MSKSTPQETPIKLSNGEFVIVCELRQRDFIVIVQKIRAKRLKDAVRAIPTDLPKDLYVELYNAAIRQVDEIDVSVVFNPVDMADQDIIETILVLSLSKKQPCTPETIQTILKNDDDFEAVWAAINGSDMQETVPQGNNAPDSESQGPETAKKK